MKKNGLNIHVLANTGNCTYLNPEGQSGWDENTTLIKITQQQLRTDELPRQGFSVQLGYTRRLFDLNLQTKPKHNLTERREQLRAYKRFRTQAVNQDGGRRSAGTARFTITFTVVINPTLIVVGVRQTRYSLVNVWWAR